MALRVLLLLPKHLPQSMKFQTHPSPSLPLLAIKNPLNSRIYCSNTNSKIKDLELALEFSTEVDKLSNQLAQKQEAMNKSKELLLTELCLYLDLGTEELKKKWAKMVDDDKWILVREFLAGWGVNFHPLSARSVKEMVDDYFVDDTESSASSSSSVLVSGLKKFLGFQNNE